MIMQMREKREGSKREVKSDLAGNRANNQKVQTRLWGVFELISSKHKHDNQTRPITGKPPERCKNKTKP